MRRNYVTLRSFYGSKSGQDMPKVTVFDDDNKPEKYYVYVFSSRRQTIPTGRYANVCVAKPLRWGGSAVVRQRGLGGFPHERLPKGFPGIKRLPSAPPTCSRSVSPWEKHVARDF
ncbi:hypothetical protein Cylst_5639 [Cylindrospermum stagnale PCC 7417]|uniref:Uncharacterized protein n=1 Tax=Cylindrospermum stagnale PCC 7417 TaxID=56107 RepID=K9X4P6_9NOST|nr:hypothetical protein Cylst_5639 [Cylindrospermum stagnale PCC 7417]